MHVQGVKAISSVSTTIARSGSLDIIARCHYTGADPGLRSRGGQNAKRTKISDHAHLGATPITPVSEESLANILNGV